MMDPSRINPPELFTRAHRRIASLSPTRSPTRQRITDDILSDLSPTTTLEAFTNPSGKLRASVEAADPTERAFGIRATIASKKIQEWVDELSTWSWPSAAGSAGFEIPAAKRRRISANERMPRAGYQGPTAGEEEYIGSLSAEEVARYENRVDDIHEDMDDLNVEEIKRTVLNTHFSPRSRPSSSGSNAPVPSMFSSYTRMDDFTAVVTATVLQALPNLSRLMRLMDVWTVRLLVLRKVPPLLLALDDAEVALKSSWQAIAVPRQDHNKTDGKEDETLDRKTFEIMRDALQEKVTILGKDLDYMLDTLEGRQDTLPEAWLDRMESIERDYGEWVVRGDRKVRAGEWSRMAKARKADEDRLKAEAEAREAIRFQAEKEQREKEERLRLEEQEASRLEQERQDAEDKLRLEQEAAAEAVRQAELARKLEEARIVAELEATRQEEDRVRKENEERMRLEQEAAAEAARQVEIHRRQEEARVRAEEENTRREAARHRLEVEEQTRLEQEVNAELARKHEEDRVRAEETAQREATSQRIEELGRLRSEQEAAAAETARDTELARKRDDETLRLREQQNADVTAASALKETGPALKPDEEEEVEIAEPTFQQKIKHSADPKISGERHSPASEVSSQEVTTDTKSPISALAHGIETDSTGPFWRPEYDKSAELEDSPQREAPSSESAGTNAPAYSVSSDLPDAKSSNVSSTAIDGQTIAFSASPVDSLSSSSLKSKITPFDGSDDTNRHQPKARIVPEPILVNPPSSGTATTVSHHEGPLTPRQPETPTTDIFPHKASTPPTPSSPRGPITPVAVDFLSTGLPDGIVRSGEKESQGSPSKLARFRDRFGIMQFRIPSQSTASFVRPQSSGFQHLSLSSQTPNPASVSSEHSVPKSLTSNLAPSPTMDSSPPFLGLPGAERMDQEWIMVEKSTEDDDHSSPLLHGSREASDTDETSGLKAHNKTASLISGYSTSDPTPEIQQAEPTEYFRPMLSPIKTDHATTSASASPSKTLSSEEREADLDVGSRLENAPTNSNELEHGQIIQSGLARKSSIAHINSPLIRIDGTGPASIASDALHVLNQLAGDETSSPLTPCCQLSPLAMTDSFPDVDNGSPSNGRARSQTDPPADRSSSDSPPPIPAMSPRRSFHLPKPPSFSKAEPESQDFPSPPSDLPEPPVFANLEVSQASAWSSPKKSSDDQIQAQISSLLESIPARIRLTSEPDMTPFSPPDTLRPAKTRRSLTPSLRSHSSLSMRAPTPSFTLAPAYGKGSSRPRPLNGNPEIKLYHLSRSNGEAPIKLFVRLVGEHGERVMVRVGGGWADLGEYLREYASHHGRRSAHDSDKVEVQDIRPRVVSTSSTASSTSTIRGNDRSSPIARPGSAFDRPMSSLHIRKTRKSLGEADSSKLTIRTPSTPMAMTNRGREFETPPSEKSRSSSRLSWTEEEGGLGLAGPKAKKVAISERDQEWVESMKEKVRLASAEKEKWEARERPNKSFGEMDKVGGTKRLFRKG